MFYRSNQGITNTTSNEVDLQPLLQLINEWEAGCEYVETSTSGSTGTPKRIQLSRSQIKHSVRISSNFFNWSSECLFINTLPITSIAGKLMIIRALELNAHLLVLEPASDPFREASIQIIKQFSSKTVFAFVPLQLSKVYNYTFVKSNAHTLLIGGAAINPDLLKILKDFKSPVFATYGMTETATHIATQKVNKPNAQSFFESLPEIEIRKNLNNCLEIKGPQTLQQWITTNDLVQLHNDHSFKILGRADNVVNSGGVKVQIEKVENAIATVNKSQSPFFCFALPSEALGQQLCLAFVPKGDSYKVFNKNYLKRVLGKFEVPKLFFPVTQMEFTHTGKIDKQKTIDVHIRPQISNE